MNPWHPLEAELDAWRDCGRQPTLWWRDDDAHRDSAPLRRLLTIAEASGTPVALAVVPALLEPSLVGAVSNSPRVTIVQHGYAHRNYAAPGERNWELGAHRPIAQTIGELIAGRAILERQFDARFTPALVPPWNRIDGEVSAQAPGAGFRGLSTFGPRRARHETQGLVQSNAHIDLIGWRHGRAFIGADKSIERTVEHLRARRQGSVDTTEPTGILTHHLDLAGVAWDFLHEMFARTRARGAVWLDAGAVFDASAA